MRRIDCGTSGTTRLADVPAWSDLRLPAPWQRVLSILGVGAVPRPAQYQALREARILESRRNLLVSAPTNAGKSLVGLIVLIDAILHGRRALLLEPLRAIAREKAEELQRLTTSLSGELGVSVSVRLSTGDYRLDGEALGDPPPDTGELIIATPERVESILRDSANDRWLASIGAVCVDEAHLIGSAHRGPTLEYLFTLLLAQPAPPRLALLSATMGDHERLRQWLSPCDVVSVKRRYPPLRKEVIALAHHEDVNEVAAKLARTILAHHDARLLIFVYQTRAAEKLAALLTARLRSRVGRDGALAYHSQMTAARRDAVRVSFMTGDSRCVIATTALALGVNLAPSHVLVRDTTFHGEGPLSAAELLQMMGRAGRGDQGGWAAVMAKPKDAWAPGELAQALRDERLPPLVSSFELQRRRSTTSPEGPDVVTVAERVGSLLARAGDKGMSGTDIRRFFEQSLGGQGLARSVARACDWLVDPSRKIAYRDDQDVYRLTQLGQRAMRAVLPLPLAGGFGQLVRDILSLDSSDELLGAWRPLDSLVVVELTSGRSPRLRPSSERLLRKVEATMRRTRPALSLLYARWIAKSRGESRAEDVLGSLGLPSVTPSEQAYSQVCYCVFRSLVMFERSQGLPTEQVARRWQISGLEGVEERWRDNTLWLLSGLAELLDLKSFYFHLREECQAGQDRLSRVKAILRKMRREVLELREAVNLCSPLGFIIRQLRARAHAASKPTIGVRTVRRLEAAGFQTANDLVNLSVPELVRAGVRRDLARQIQAHFRRQDGSPHHARANPQLPSARAP